MKMMHILLPLAVVTLAACHKAENEIVVDPQPQPVQEETVLEFISERPQTKDESETRTYWDGETILWNTSDWIRMGYTVNGVWQNASGNADGDAKLYGSKTTVLSEDNAVASFLINSNLTGNTEGTHVFYAVFPGSATGTTAESAPKAAVTVPATQTPLADSFDPTADVMLGHSTGTYTARPTDPIKLLWERVVAHGVITLKALPADSDETVTSVTLTAQAGADLTGEQSMDLITGTYEPATTNSTPNRVVIKGDNLALDSEGNLTFWMAILPETITSLTIEAVTDRATYTKQITGFSRTFLGNRRNILSINMSNAQKTENQTPAGGVYVRVTSQDELGEGHYLLAYTYTESSETKAYILSGKTGSGSNTFGTYKSVSVTDDTIAYDDAEDCDIVAAATSNGYSLQLGDTYLGYTGSGNYLQFNSTFTASSYEWTLTSSDANVSIQNVGTGSRYIRWNNNSNGLRFSCYLNTQEAVQLYKLNGSSPSVVTKDATDITVASATLNATFANLGTTNVQDVHFLWGTSEGDLTQTAYAEDFDVASGTFHATIGSLEENATYYYQAVLQYCADGTDYILLSGNVLSFTTLSSQSSGNAGLQWLGCYEIPAIDLENQNSYSGTGQETFGDTYWYNYKTTNSMQKAVTHTYQYNNKVYRNFTTLMDGDKRCPLWTAYPMHSTAYPDNEVGRVGSFSTSTSYDPAIPSSWQSSGSTSDYNNGNGYSRGHHCASADRQTTKEANQQTFYYTNQSPQWQNSFNSGVWEDLESLIRNNIPSGRDTLYIVVGTLFEDGNTGDSNDGGTVSRPSHFYKLLMLCSFNTSGVMTGAQGTAYLFTNEAHTNSSLSSYLTSIDAIEERTGFDFFANVPQTYQTAAERTKVSLW